MGEGTGAGGGGDGAGIPSQGQPGGGAASGTALGSGGAAGATGASGGAEASPYAWIPEKFHVKSEDGAFNLEASARKVEEHRSHLEKRLGSGDIPPKTAADYKLNIPEALAEKINADELAKSDDFKAMQTNLHALGLSQKQMDGVVSELLQQGMKLRSEDAVMSEAECTAALREVDGWKSPAEYTQQMGKALQAAKAFWGPQSDAMVARYGNDPAICQLLAKVGAELGEDRQPSPEAQAQVQDSMDTLMASPAYLNDHDPQHHATVKKVEALQARLSGTKPVVGGRTMSFTTG